MEKFKFNLEDELKHFEGLWDSRPPVDKKKVHSKEKWNKRAASWIKEFDDPCSRKRSDNRLKATLSFVNRYKVVDENSSVIDMGCGLGRFAVEFARKAEHVTGCDLSNEMIKYAKEHGKEEGLDNKLTWIDCDFKHTDIDKMGWRGAFDLVFTSLTPAVDGVESLEKICAMSRDYCFNSTFVNSEDNLDIILYEELTGKVFPDEFTNHHHWFYSLYNILNLKGYFPRSDYYEELWHSYLDVDDETVEFFKDRLEMKYRMYDVDKDKIKKILLNNADVNGKVKYEHHTIYGFLLWNVNGKVDAKFEEILV